MFFSKASLMSWIIHIPSSAKAVAPIISATAVRRYFVIFI